MEIKNLTRGNSSTECVVIAVGTGACSCAKNIHNEVEKHYNVRFYACDSIPLGCGGDIDKACRKAETLLSQTESCNYDKVRNVILISMLGGSTGTGASVTFAKHIKKKGINLSCVVTLPFEFEGEKKIDKVHRAVSELSKYSRQIILLTNNIDSANEGNMKLLEYLRKNDFAISKTISFLCEDGGFKKPWYSRLLHNL